MNKYSDFEKLESSKLRFGYRDLIWQLFSWIGHRVFSSKPPEKESDSHGRYLNLGSGAVREEQFVNADFYRLHKLWSKERADWFLDLNKPLNCDSNYWDGVILVHVNEHLTYQKNYMLMVEIFRVLKPGGDCRLVIPDLDHYLDWKPAGSNLHAKMDRYSSLPEAISNLTQNHKHISTWNFDLMKQVLEEIGFVDIQKSAYLEGRNGALLIDGQNHEWQSFYCECSKPY